MPPDVDAVTPTGTPQQVVDTLRAWLDGPAEQRLVVATSGSTGTPKRVILRREAVLASVAATEERLGATGRWVLAVPPTYVAGIQVIVRSLLAGHEPILGTDRWPMDEDPWFVSLVPTQLRRMLAEPEEATALAGAHTVLLGGGPIDPGLRERAAEAGITTVATYGSAETAGGCVYDGRSLPGVRIDTEADGRIVISGPTLFERYLDEPVLTAEALRDGWFRTSDLGRIEGDRLSVLGRIDDVVVTGGLNVPGPAVAVRLREHTAVTDAEVIGVPDLEWGNRVVAVVEGSLGLDAARDWVAQVHPRSWAPRQLVTVDALPRLANGKPDRVAMRALAQETP